MTVAKTFNRKDYTGDGSNKTFAFDFKIYAETDLMVYVDGIFQVLNTNYTVSGGPDWTETGGNVVFGTAPGSGISVIILRTLPLTQGTHWPEGDPFPAKSHENAADRLVMIAQQFNEAVGRILKLPNTSTLTGIEIPIGANKGIRWNSAGDNFELFTVDPATTSVITAKGDLVQGNAAGIPERLPIGVEGEILKTKLGLPDWELSNSIKLDDLGTPDDNTDLDATSIIHGLFPKLIDDTTFDVSITKHGLCPKAPNNAIKVLRGNATWGDDKVVQRVNFQTGAYAASTALIPFDDTIPQNTEGFECMSLAITPNNVNNILYIDVVVVIGASATTSVCAALFQDAIVNALAATTDSMTASAIMTTFLRHKVVAGTISATTFKVRIGGSAAGTMYFNGVAGARLWGGIAASSITITEVAA